MFASEPGDGPPRKATSEEASSTVAPMCAGDHRQTVSCRELPCPDSPEQRGRRAAPGAVAQVGSAVVVELEVSIQGGL